MERENKTPLGHRLNSGKKQEKKHQSLFSPQITMPHAILQPLSHKGDLTIEQGRVALECGTVCKRLLILNVNVRMLKQSNKMSSHQNDKKREKHNLYIIILFQSYYCISVITF